MILDVLLPSVLFLIAVTIVLLYSRIEKRINSLFGGQELRLEHIILLVATIGTMVTILVFIPEQALLIVFLSVYVVLLFSFTYLLVPKWYLAVLAPVLFILLFRYSWNIYFFNFFAIVLGISISVYLGNLFTWKTTAAFAALLTIMDIIQVLLTGYMVKSFEKLITLELPIAIIIPTFPSKLPYPLVLGLGDVFLFGLLSIQIIRKYGRKFGLASIISITVVFLLLQTILLNTDVETFPATILVISGWLTALGARYLYKSKVRAKQLV